MTTLDTGAARAGTAAEPLHFSAPAAFEVKTSGEPGSWTLAGHFARFNVPSADMGGGFVYRIRPGAFAKVLAGRPDVHLVRDHTMSLVMARTTNATLKLREDAEGLHGWARVAPVSYSADLRTLMERGDVDQASFSAFIGAEEWSVDEAGQVVCDIVEFDELLEVTVCPQGAFNQTKVAVIAARHFSNALEAGRVPGLSPAGRASSKTPVAAVAAGREVVTTALGFLAASSLEGK
jgi:HK97 family phage prohead protease